MEIPKAQWHLNGWKTSPAVEWELRGDGKMIRREIAAVLPITETPDDLKLLARDAEEFTYFDLQRQIADLKSKGIDATNYEVDLQSKLAFPLISPLMVLLAIPFALRATIDRQHFPQLWRRHVDRVRLLGPLGVLYFIRPQRSHAVLGGRLDTQCYFRDDRFVFFYRGRIVRSGIPMNPANPGQQP